MVREMIYGQQGDPAILPLKKSTPRETIEDPDKIELKIKEARRRFSLFLNSKIAKSVKIDFEIADGDMLMNLGLTDIPRERARQELQELVRGTNGGLAIIEKENKEYIVVSDSEKLKGYYIQREAQRIANVLKVFADNPDRGFITGQIVGILGISKDLVRNAIEKLLKAGEIYLIETEPTKDLKRGRPTLVYKLTKKE